MTYTDLSKARKNEVVVGLRIGEIGANSSGYTEMLRPILLVSGAKRLLFEFACEYKWKIGLSSKKKRSSFGVYMQKI